MVIAVLVKNNFLLILMSKQEIIANVYYDRSGYGNRAQTLKESREKDKTITEDDVEEFFKNNVEEKRKQRGVNAFVAPYASHTFQVDLFFISKKDLENQKFRIGLVLVDVFSKVLFLSKAKNHRIFSLGLCKA